MTDRTPSTETGITDDNLEYGLEYFAPREGFAPRPPSALYEIAYRGLMELQRLRSVPEPSAGLAENWFMCGHPAWPDPLAVGHDKSEAVRLFRHYRGALRGAWLVCTTEGPRTEYTNSALLALLDSVSPTKRKGA
jgi:hypothetical protein